MTLNGAQRLGERHLDLVTESLIGALDTNLPAEGWRHNRAVTGLTSKSMPVASGAVRTMIGRERLLSLRGLIRDLLQRQIPGDLMELGCWRGGSVILMKACLEVYQPGSNRQIWCADTFDSHESHHPVGGLGDRMLRALLARTGSYLPAGIKKQIVGDMLQYSFPREDYGPETVDYFIDTFLRERHQHPQPFLRLSREDVQEAFRRFGLLDDRVQFLQGWFSETLPKAPVESLALLRLDGDFYRSTRDGLTLAYHKLSPGGLCIVDDYGAFPECRRAVDEFRSEQGITATVVTVDAECVYWIRE